MEVKDVVVADPVRRIEIKIPKKDNKDIVYLVEQWNAAVADKKRSPIDRMVYWCIESLARTTVRTDKDVKEALEQVAAQTAALGDARKALIAVAGDRQQRSVLARLLEHIGSSVKDASSAKSAVRQIALLFSPLVAAAPPALLPQACFEVALATCFFLPDKEHVWESLTSRALQKYVHDAALRYGNLVHATDVHPHFDHDIFWAYASAARGQGTRFALYQALEYAVLYGRGGAFETKRGELQTFRRFKLFPSDQSQPEYGLSKQSGLASAAVAKAADAFVAAGDERQHVLLVYFAAAVASAYPAKLLVVDPQDTKDRGDSKKRKKRDEEEDDEEPQASSDPDNAAVRFQYTVQSLARIVQDRVDRNFLESRSSPSSGGAAAMDLGSPDSASDADDGARDSDDEGGGKRVKQEESGSEGDSDSDSSRSRSSKRQKTSKTGSRHVKTKSKSSDVQRDASAYPAVLRARIEAQETQGKRKHLKGLNPEEERRGKNLQVAGTDPQRLHALLCAMAIDPIADMVRLAGDAPAKKIGSLLVFAPHLVSSHFHAGIALESVGLLGCAAAIVQNAIGDAARLAAIDSDRNTRISATQSSLLYAKAYISAGSARRVTENLMLELLRFPCDIWRIDTRHDPAAFDRALQWTVNVVDRPELFVKGSPIDLKIAFEALLTSTGIVDAYALFSPASARESAEQAAKESSKNAFNPVDHAPVIDAAEAKSAAHLSLMHALLCNRRILRRLVTSEDDLGADPYASQAEVDHVRFPYRSRSTPVAVAVAVGASASSSAAAEKKTAAKAPKAAGKQATKIPTVESLIASYQAMGMLPAQARAAAQAQVAKASGAVESKRPAQGAPVPAQASPPPPPAEHKAASNLFWKKVALPDLLDWAFRRLVNHQTYSASHPAAAVAGRDAATFRWITEIGTERALRPEFDAEFKLPPSKFRIDFAADPHNRALHDFRHDMVLARLTEALCDCRAFNRVAVTSLLTPDGKTLLRTSQASLWWLARCDLVKEDVLVGYLGPQTQYRSMRAMVHEMRPELEDRKDGIDGALFAADAADNLLRAFANDSAMPVDLLRVWVDGTPMPEVVKLEASKDAKDASVARMRDEVAKKRAKLQARLDLLENRPHEAVTAFFAQMKLYNALESRMRNVNHGRDTRRDLLQSVTPVNKTNKTNIMYLEQFYAVAIMASGTIQKRADFAGTSLEWVVAECIAAERELSVCDPQFMKPSTIVLPVLDAALVTAAFTEARAKQAAQGKAQKRGVVKMSLEDDNGDKDQKTKQPRIDLHKYTKKLVMDLVDNLDRAKNMESLKQRLQKRDLEDVALDHLQRLSQMSTDFSGAVIAQAARKILARKPANKGKWQVRMNLLRNMILDLVISLDDSDKAAEESKRKGKPSPSKNIRDCLVAYVNLIGMRPPIEYDFTESPKYRFRSGTSAISFLNKLRAPSKRSKKQAALPAKDADDPSMHNQRYLARIEAKAPGGESKGDSKDAIVMSSPAQRRTGSSKAMTVVSEDTTVQMALVTWQQFANRAMFSNRFNTAAVIYAFVADQCTYDQRLELFSDICKACVALKFGVRWDNTRQPEPQVDETRLFEFFMRITEMLQLVWKPQSEIDRERAEAKYVLEQEAASKAAQDSRVGDVKMQEILRDHEVKIRQVAQADIDLAVGRSLTHDQRLMQCVIAVRMLVSSYELELSEQDEDKKSAAPASAWTRQIRDHFQSTVLPAFGALVFDALTMQDRAATRPEQRLAVRKLWAELGRPQAPLDSREDGDDAQGPADEPRMSPVPGVDDFGDDAEADAGADVGAAGADVEDDVASSSGSGSGSGSAAAAADVEDDATEQPVQVEFMGEGGEILVEPDYSAYDVV